MFAFQAMSAARPFIPSGGVVTTLKDFGGGSSFDMVYSVPMNRLYVNFVPGGGNAGIYETTYDNTPTWISRSNTNNSNGFPLYAVNATRLDVHPTLPILYNSGGSSQIYRSYLTFDTAHTTKSGYPSNVVPRLTADGATLFGVGTSLTRAPVDGAGAIGTLATLALTPSSGYTTRGSCIDPDTGSMWILRIKTTTGAQELMLSEYNAAGTAFIRSIQLPMADPTLVALYDSLAISPGGKFYIEFSSRAVKLYDLTTNTFSHFAGNDTVSGTVDGAGGAARFTAIGSIRYSAALGTLLVPDGGRLRTISVAPA